MNSWQWLSHRHSSSRIAPSEPRPASTLAVVLTICTVAVGLAALSGVAGGTVVDGQYEHNMSSDDEPPTLRSGDRIDDTTIELRITDNHDVDESTISRSEFVTEEGTIENISVNETGSNTTVILSLESPVNEENLTLGAVGETAISDVDGNVLGEGDSETTLTVTGMDGVAPRVSVFEVTDATGGPATMRIKALESLASFNISVRGAANEYLDETSFEQTGPLTYEGTYTPPTDGQYRLTLFRYSDAGENTETIDYTEYIDADLSGPETVASIDLARSENLSLVFDAAQTTDPSGVANYTWQFGDGTTATGERVSHTFRPGNYTVTLDAVDNYGNSGTDSVVLNLTTGSGNVTDVNDSVLEERLSTNETSVSVDRSNSAASDAIVTAENVRAGTPVTVPALTNESSENHTALATHGNVSLDGLNVTLSTNRSVSLGLSMASPETVADVADATRTDPLGGLTVVHTVPDSDIANVTFSFSVSRDRLRTLNVSAENVSLYRYHDTRWQKVPTTPANATNETQQFHARSPGFSRFAVTANTTDSTDEGSSDDDASGGDTPDDGSDAATEPATANLSVTDATLTSSRIEMNGTVTVDTTIANSGNSSGVYTAGLELDGQLATTARSPSVPAGESETFQIAHTVENTGNVSVSVNGTTAGTVTVESSGDSETDESDTDESDAEDNQTRQFEVTNVTIGSSQIQPGDTLTVNVTVENNGSSNGFYTAGLALNGGVVATDTSPPIPVNDSRTFSVTHSVNETGEFSVSINGTTAGTVTVGSTDSGGGGLLGSVLGFLPLDILDPVFGLFGFLPLALLRPLFLFVVLPVAVIYGILKALAIYLGY